ncbi:MAG: DUF3179 domain-containing protein, partial [Phycisphaerales bacterium]
MTGTSPAKRGPVYWSPGRIALGVVIVLVAGSFIGVVLSRELRNIRDGMANDVLYAELLRTTTEEHAAEFNLDNLVIPIDQISFGGPPKDGIPAISDPEHVALESCDRLADDDRVVGVVVGGEARAYPLRVLLYHEVVNDEIGGTPVAIVYCPLCDSVTAVERRLDGAVREFGVSGLLFNSNVLLYDRSDDSLWSQVGLTAISGPNAGRSLPHLPWEITTAAAWRTRHPDSTVMSFETGYDRDYDRNPYPNYFNANDRLMFPVANEDDRLQRRDLVVGIRFGDTTRAYPLATIRSAPDGLVRDSIDGEAIVLSVGPDGESVRIVEVPAKAL